MLSLTRVKLPNLEPIQPELHKITKSKQTLTNFIPRITTTCTGYLPVSKSPNNKYSVALENTADNYLSVKLTLSTVGEIQAVQNTIVLKSIK